MKKQKETISVDITLDHYGFYHNDEHFGNVHKPYRDWVIKKNWYKKNGKIIIVVCGQQSSLVPSSSIVSFPASQKFFCACGVEG